MPTTDRKLRVLLCHSSQDKPIVRELYKRLLAESWIEPWLDKENLLPGQEWELEIEKSVETADVVIVCLSKNSVEKEGYYQKEIKKVLDVADEKPEGTIFIIPLRLDDCQPPRRLAKWQYVDYFPSKQRASAYQRLLVSLESRAKTPDILTPNPVAHPDNDKPHVNDWNGVDFLEWNPRMNHTSAKCGVEVINNGNSKISECYVELIALLEENNGEYINIYEEIKSHLPCILAWQIHNKFIYEKIEIERTDNPYLAITYNEEFLCIKGEKDFVYAWLPQGHVVAKIKIWGKIGKKSLPAKILFVEMFANSQRVTALAITEKLPKLHPLLSRFSVYLDEMIRDGNPNPSGVSFLNKVKIAL